MITRTTVLLFAMMGVAVGLVAGFLLTPSIKFLPYTCEESIVIETAEDQL